MSNNFRPIVKICGLKTQDAIIACEENAVDLIGFIVYPKSSRHVSASNYAELANACRNTSTVLVTVDADDALLDEYLSAHRPDFVQCHGTESPERLDEIRGYGVKIIKAFGVAEVADLSKVFAYRNSADILLLDAKPTKNELPGGNAKSFDWSILSNANLGENWMLSGGLHIDNIKQALSETNAPMIDISSGVESESGVKDVPKIKAFMAALSLA